jgi:hypothetical protein
MNEPEKRVGATRHAEHRQYPCARLAAQHDAHPKQHLRESLRAPSMRRCQLRQSLGEHRARTRRVLAPEPPDVQMQSHRQALAREVGQGALIAALDTGGQATASWALGLRVDGSQLQHNRVLVASHVFEVQIRDRKRKNGFDDCHCNQRSPLGCIYIVRSSAVLDERGDLER